MHYSSRIWLSVVVSLKVVEEPSGSTKSNQAAQLPPELRAVRGGRAPDVGHLVEEDEFQRLTRQRVIEHDRTGNSASSRCRLFAESRRSRPEDILNRLLGREIVPRADVDRDRRRTDRRVTSDVRTWLGALRGAQSLGPEKIRRR